VNTSRQIGGAIGIAAVSAVAATSSASYASAHDGLTATSPVALDHGFRTALYVLTGLLLVGAAIAITLVKSASAAGPASASAPGEPDLEPLREAA
jgi:hypothetical protein